MSFGMTFLKLLCCNAVIPLPYLNPFHTQLHDAPHSALQRLRYFLAKNDLHQFLAWRNLPALEVSGFFHPKKNKKNFISALHAVRHA